jgi:SAM-dependent methyltransferase
MTRTGAGDVDYERHGEGYAVHRRTDPRIAALVHDGLGPAQTVLNVGAGAGSYEPTDRRVVAVEPSEAMRAQRPADRAPVVAAVAEHLPFANLAFDASMATITVHQWTNARRGLGELRRVTRGPVVILTFDGDALARFWLAAYVPELIVAERRRYPAIDAIRRALGGATVRTVPVPIDCVDGFTEAYYARPECLLDPAVRRAQSAWTFVDPAIADRGIAQLRADLDSGVWDARYGSWRTMSSFEGSLCLIVADRVDRRP